MLAPLVILVLAAEPPPPLLAALDLEAQQVSPAVAKLVSTQLTQRLVLRGLTVVTPSDLTAVLGVERQKQLLGCSEDTSCLAEIGAALDARGVLSGSVGQLGGTRLLNVKVVSSTDAQPLAVCSAKADDDEALVAAAERCADDIVLALLPAPPVTRRTWALAPLIGGAAVAVAGGVLLGLAASEKGTVANTALEPPVVFAAARRGEAFGTAGLVLAGVGAAAALTGALLYFLGPQPAQPVALLTPHGGFIGITGVWP